MVQPGARPPESNWRFQASVRARRPQLVVQAVRHEPSAARPASARKPSSCSNRESCSPACRAWSHSTSSPAGQAPQQTCSPQTAGAAQPLPPAPRMLAYRSFSSECKSMRRRSQGSDACPGSEGNGETPFFVSYIFRLAGGDFYGIGVYRPMRSGRALLGLAAICTKTHRLAQLNQGACGLKGSSVYGRRFFDPLIRPE